MIREFVLAPNCDTEIAGQGQVYIKYYGSEECALMDPARDLSPFDHCFERRSANPSDEFQEALKQAMEAIKKKETKQGTDSS
uniref:Uncharacterized protein n=1 Tax=Daucus carota subsp. sativus TaxID=79200 RepID=A0A175YNG1_DAUCS